jgi:hypothetical protein
MARRSRVIGVRRTGRCGPAAPGGGRAGPLHGGSTVPGSDEVCAGMVLVPFPGAGWDSGARAAAVKGAPAATAS